MTNFTDEIKNFVIDRLNDYENLEFYGCDLASELTMNENKDGCYYIYTEDALNFIRENWTQAAETWKYFNDDLGMSINPFEDPTAYTFYMLDYGVNELLNSLDFVSDNWDDEITLTRENIDKLTQEINNL